MTSPRPYLLRAIYDWLVDGGLTPHLVVEVSGDDVRVPRQFVENGAIVLNVSPSAVRGLELGNEFVEFNARFAGTPHQVSVPISAVQAIYARENGQGLVLTEFDGAMDDDARVASDSAGDGAPAGSQDAPRRTPHLKVVK
ncbi:MAG: ClpXP protease specificity-enhancing factor [Gammaproteobacteria bacterium]